MIPKMKNTLLTLSLLLAITLPAVELGDSVLARIGDKVITSYDVRTASESKETALPTNLSQHQRMEAVAEIRAKVLEDLIVNELVWLDYKDLKVKVPQAVIQERIDQVIKSTANSDEERFRDILHQRNTTYQEFEEEIIKQTAIEMLLYERTRRNIFITSAQIQRYFNEHRQDYAQSARHHVQAIMLKKENATSELIAEIRGALSKGEDFAVVARKYSQGANASEGGDLGWMDSIAPALEKCLAKLKPGEISSEDLELGSGIYIVKLLENQGGGDAELTPEIKKEIKKILVDIEANRKREEYIKTLYMKYPIRRY